MDCKHCKYPETLIVSTRKDDSLNQTYRRRHCIKCGGRFTTQEHYRDNYKRAPYKTAPPNKILPP